MDKEKIEELIAAKEKEHAELIKADREQAQARDVQLAGNLKQANQLEGAIAALKDLIEFMGGHKEL